MDWSASVTSGSFGKSPATGLDETEAGAYDVICDLRLKYRGDRNYPKNPGEVRVTYKVLPEQVFPKQ